MNRGEILFIKDTIKIVKRKATGWEKIFAITEKGFLSRRYVCICINHIYVILYVIGKTII